MVSVALVFDEDSPDKPRDVGGETGRDASAPVASAELPKDPTPDVSGAQDSRFYAEVRCQGFGGTMKKPK